MMNNTLKLLALLGAIFMLSGCEKAPTLDEKQAVAILNEALHTQMVAVSAPGIPSKVEELCMVAEDPHAPENQGKKYHPAVIRGWEHALAGGKILEQNGVIRIESGTFDEIDFFENPFTFTGYRMYFIGEGANNLLVIPRYAKVCLKVGSVGVDKITKIDEVKEDKSGKDPIYTTSVSFVSKLDEPKSFVNEELLEYTGIRSFLGGAESVDLTYNGKEKKWEITDEIFLRSLKKPVLDFQNTSAAAKEQ